MPMYDFVCQKCESKYDDLAPYDETGKYSKVKCPHCGAINVHNIKKQNLNKNTKCNQENYKCPGYKIGIYID